MAVFVSFATVNVGRRRRFPTAHTGRSCVRHICGWRDALRGGTLADPSPVRRLRRPSVSHNNNFTLVSNFSLFGLGGRRFVCWGVGGGLCVWGEGKGRKTIAFITRGPLPPRYRSSLII